MVIAAIYLPPPGRDIHFHAFTGCRHGKVRIGESLNYRVNTEAFARELGRLPCPKCWFPNGGYRPEWEKVQ